MYSLPRLLRRPITPMNVPIHQVMFTADPEAVPPPAANEIRETAGGQPYRLWLLEDARGLIGDAYGPELLNAFDVLQPFAYKADLARYCLVHHFGGIYIDLSANDFVGFDVSDFEFIGFRDPNNAHSSWKIGNHMFYATKDSPILEACIAECLENINQRFYGKDPHFPTGPSVLGRAVANHSLEAKIQIGDFWCLHGRHAKYTLPGQGVIGRGKVAGRNLGGISGVRGGNNYNVMWREGTVYQADNSSTAARALVES